MFDDFDVGPQVDEFEYDDVQLFYGKNYLDEDKDNWIPPYKGLDI